MKLKFADLVFAKSPRAAASPSLTVPRRADRAAKPASKGDATGSRIAGMSKAGRPGNSSRFAHWAGAPDQVDEAPPRPTPNTSPHAIPAGHGMRSAAIRRALAGSSPPAATPLPSTAEAMGEHMVATARRLGVIK